MIELTVLLVALVFTAWAVRRHAVAAERQERSLLAAAMQSKHAQPSARRLYLLRMDAVRSEAA